MALDKLNAELITLYREAKAITDDLKIADKASELNLINKKMESADFWSDSQKAQALVKQKSNLEAQVLPWEKFYEQVELAISFCEFDDMESEVKAYYNQSRKTFAELKKELRFNGPYDNHSVILSIYAGAGGTDAQDWAEMLLRMYSRWADKQDLKISLLQESKGEEAGIKSASLKIESGKFLYGKLKHEDGVHRLVRLSPFNADNLRQTSFAKVEVLPLIDQPEEVKLNPDDLKVDVYRSGGKGGQSVNTTDSAVRITHIPTNISVAIQNERSQIQNKQTAMQILVSKLTQLQAQQHTEKIDDLKGDFVSAEWGNQIRNYILHPYKLVKDTRSGHQSKQPEQVLDGEIDSFIESNLSLKQA